jgi:signal transduction histidine kinase
MHTVGDVEARSAAPPIPARTWALCTADDALGRLTAKEWQAMREPDKVNILMVDDQPDKLLTYAVILRDLGEHLITAGSAREALEQLLKTDIAVILLDVRMPEIDGFELAKLIRDHPRYQQTAILFISAVHRSDFDQLQGYAHGAVDYLTAPIVPELLRAKVRVFADLYRQRQQLARLNRALADRMAELQRETAARQRLEREAQRAEHFALLGRLAAGVSHEIRNPLAALFLHVDVLEEELRQPTPESAAQVAEALAEIRTNLGRLEDLVQDYLTLVRTSQIERTPHDFGAALQAWAAEWQPLARRQGVQLRLEGLAALGTASFHAHTLYRALLNLVQNALDAMPQGGTLTLAGQRTAPHLVLQVRDTGSGIPAEQCATIFEPLHTTKPGGTGLGLYIVQEIVTAHGGQITVESVVGHGTTFTLRFPWALDTSQPRP